MRLFKIFIDAAAESFVEEINWWWVENPWRGLLAVLMWAAVFAIVKYLLDWSMA
jgi:hypothetical protein